MDNDDLKDILSKFIDHINDQDGFMVATGDAGRAFPLRDLEKQKLVETFIAKLQEP